jgi:hypothetical protein
LLFSACEMKEIGLSDLNLSTNGHQYEIAVNCYITTENANHYIKLSQPGNYAHTTESQAVSNAEIYITDENENIYLFAETDEKGVYMSVDMFQPVVYELYILTISINNKQYTAQTTVASVSDIESDNMPLPREDENVTGSMIYFSGLKHTFGYSENVKWLWLYANDNLSNYKNPFSPDINFNYSHKGGEPQGFFPDNLYGFGTAGEINDTVLVRKYSVSDEYHKFLLALFSETDWKTGIFSTISGNLPTNISQGGTGYFYISDIKTAEIPITELINQK